jgi:hypothetical protein
LTLIRVQPEGNHPKVWKAPKAAIFAAALMVAPLQGCSLLLAHQPSDGAPIKANIEHHPRPGQLQGGKGTIDSRYELYLLTGRETEGRGSWDVIAPVNYQTNIGGIYLNVNFTLSQLKAGSRDATAKELGALIERTAKYHIGKQGYPAVVESQCDMGPIVKAFSEKVGAADESVKSYLDGK